MDNVVAFWLDNYVGTHRETEGMENECVCLSISHDIVPSQGEPEKKGAWHTTLTENKAKNSGSALIDLQPQFTNASAY